MSVTENSVDPLWLLPSIFATLPPSFRHLPLPVFYPLHHQDMVVVRIPVQMSWFKTSCLGAAFRHRPQSHRHKCFMSWLESFFKSSCRCCAELYLCMRSVRYPRGHRHQHCMCAPKHHISFNWWLNTKSRMPLFPVATALRQFCRIPHSMPCGRDVPQYFMGIRFVQLHRNFNPTIQSRVARECSIIMPFLDGLIIPIPGASSWKDCL